MKTLGIDLSADPKKTAACSIDWSTYDVRLLPRPSSDEQLVEAIADADLTGIDVPLGWPDPFIAAIAAHQSQSGWLPTEDVPPMDREPLRFRATDLAVRRAGAQPLSVSTDRIGVAAMRGARIQHLALTRGLEVDRSGASGRIAEVYPAAALRHWGLTSTGYKTSKNALVLVGLVRHFAGRCGPLAQPIEDLLEGSDDDDFDAVVCALVARAVLKGQTTLPRTDVVGTAKREGWIHVPTADVLEVIA